VIIPSICALQPGSRESVILKSKRKNPEELVETFSAIDNKDNSGIENIKTEDKTMEDIKDDDVDDMEDIGDDKLIFKYIHKKFGTKNRECTPFVKKIDSIILEVDPLEGTSEATELLNR
jgi:hypothetical protein